MEQVLLALIAGTGFALAGMLGLVGIGVRPAVRLAAIAVAAGILLSITVSDLIPDALADAGRSRTAFGFMVGFLVLFLMESLTRAHVHHHGADDEHLHHHTLDHHHAARPFTIGLALHNFTDGLAIGTTAALSKSAATAVTVGVLVHQLPVGISFAAVLTALHATRRQTLRRSVLCALMIPLGAVAIVALPTMSDAAMGTLVAGAAGALCYVATGHLLPEAQSERHAVVAPVFVMALLLTTAWFTLVSTG